MTNDERMTKLETRMTGALRTVFLVVAVSLLAIPAGAQDSAPPKEKPGIQLEFVPPPMEGGTISLGVYDTTGKLVRVLHQEAQPSEFFAALNGLITYWDGKDDSGKLMPAGKYSARGYMAGSMDFEGVAFLGNDWVTEENSPRIRKMLDVSCDPEGNLLMFAQQSDNTFVRIKCDATGSITKKENIEQFAAQNVGDGSYFGQVPWPTIRNGLIFYGTEELKIPSLADPIGVYLSPAGKTQSIWVIDRTKEGECEVKQFSLEGEFKRHLAIPPNEPAPVKIAASQTSDTIFLLEAKGNLQRVRALTLLPAATDSASPAQSSAPSATSGTSPKSSTWKVIYSKTIRFSDTPDQVRDLLKTAGGKPFVPQEKIKLTLLPNPLEQDKLGAVEISIGVDAKGSFLKAGDGLPLCRVSETPNLRWAAMSGEPGSKVITIFQSDGAVVEQFKAARLANMMSFDCGDFDFDPAKMK